MVPRPAEGKPTEMKTRTLSAAPLKKRKAQSLADTLHAEAASSGHYPRADLDAGRLAAIDRGNFERGTGCEVQPKGTAHAAFNGGDVPVTWQRPVCAPPPQQLLTPRQLHLIAAGPCWRFALLPRPQW